MAQHAKMNPKKIPMMPPVAKATRPPESAGKHVTAKRHAKMPEKISEYSVIFFFKKNPLCIEKFFGSFQIFCV
jgi:hypothetical protein